jgi:acyl-CoA oxidase
MTTTSTTAGHSTSDLVAALRDSLGGRWAHVRQQARDDFDAETLLPDPSLTLEEQRERVARQMELLSHSDYVRSGFPVSAGGTGDIGASVTAFEMLGHTDLSLMVKAGVHWGLFGGAVANLGTERHHTDLLPRIISLELPGCFAMTETGHGSDVQSLGTSATYDASSDELVVHTPHPAARKDYIGGAARDARMAVVFAQLVTGTPDAPQQNGVHGVLVPIRDDEGRAMPGVGIEDCGPKMGLNGVDNGRLWFDGVRVPRDNLLDRFAQVTEDGRYRSPIDNPDKRFFTMLGTLVQGRVCVGGAGINAAKVALTLAVRYAVRRRQFNATSPDEEELLLDYGLHQRRLLPLLAENYALHFAQEVVALRLHDVFSLDPDQAEDEQARRELESRAAGTKALGTWHATRVIQECREACGGAGYLAVNRFAALKADTDVFTTFEGDNHVLLQLVAKGLLTDYASDFEDLDQLGMVRFVAELALETVIERTAAHQLLERIKDVLPGGDDGWDQEAGLLDPDYQLTMLRFREEHALSGVARRLKRGIDEGLKPGEVFSHAQDHVIAAARAHVERLVLEAFVDKVTSLPAGDLRSALALLCDLHALSTVERDRAWFMEHGRLTAARSKAITREVNDLCRKLRPIAVDLVDAYGVPRELLRSPDLL